ncbi:titin homolog isoform X2 [Macrobrachium nipponense]
MGRRALRDALISRKRMDGCEATTAKSMEMSLKRNNRPGLADVTSDYPNKSIREHELQRYEQLLKWREERRKKLNIEKRTRKPSFKTGVFQPDQPKFLVSDDVKQPDSKISTPAKPPPFKYLQRSSTKYGFTPGASSKKVHRLCAGVTPTTSIAKVPKFNLRTTPNQSLGRAAILQTKAVDQKENLNSNIMTSSRKTEDKSHIQRKNRSVHGMDLKRVLRNKSTRKRIVSMDTEDLGVKALPATPDSTELQRNRRSGVKALPATPVSIEIQRSRRSGVKPLPATPVNIDIRRSRRSFVRLQPEVAGDAHSSESVSFAPENFDFNFVATLKDGEPAAGNVAPALTFEEKVATSRKEISRSSTDMSVNNSFSDDPTSTNESVSKVNENITNCEVEEMYNEVPTSGRELPEEKDISEIGEKDKTPDCEKSYKMFIDEEALKDETDGTGELKVVERNIEMKHENELENENVLEAAKKVEEYIPAEIVQNNYVQQEETVSLKSDLEVDHDIENSKENKGIADCNKDLLNPDDICNLSLVAKTPMSALRRSTRRSARISGCIDTTLSPVMSKLRPRTPCSRSTRRSMNAHTDFMIDQIATPRVQKSLRKSSRRSIKRLRSEDAKDLVVPLVFDDSELGDSDMKSQELVPESSIVLEEDIIEEEAEVKTVSPSVNVKSPIPETIEVMQTPKAENMVTPRSSRRKGKVSWMVHESPYINTEKRSGNSKRSGVPSDIISLFDDVPTDGSPLPAHLTPLINKCRSDQGQSPILPEAPISFSIDEGQVTDSPEEQTCSNLLDLLKPSTPLARNDTPDVDVWGEESPEVVDNSAILISVDASTTIPALPVLPVTRRSCRISLLPGLTESPASGKLTTVDEDLIAWETPMMSAKKTKKIEKDKPRATPSRRSRRLSKVCPE